MFLMSFVQLDIKIKWNKFTPIQFWSVCDDLVNNGNPFLSKTRCIFSPKNSCQQNDYDFNTFCELRGSPLNRKSLFSELSLRPPSFHNWQEINKFILFLWPLQSYFNLSFFEMVQLIQYHGLIVDYMFILEVENCSTFIVYSLSHPLYHI